MNSTVSASPSCPDSRSAHGARHRQRYRERSQHRSGPQPRRPCRTTGKLCSWTLLGLSLWPHTTTDGWQHRSDELRSLIRRGSCGAAKSLSQVKIVGHVSSWHIRGSGASFPWLLGITRADIQPESRRRTITVASASSDASASCFRSDDP